MTFKDKTALEFDKLDEFSLGPDNPLTLGVTGNDTVVHFPLLKKNKIAIRLSESSFPEKSNLGKTMSPVLIEQTLRGSGRKC